MIYNYKKISFVLVIFVIGVCIAIVTQVNISRSKKAMEYYQNILSSTYLEFSKEPVKQLEKMKPKDGWKYLREHNLYNVVWGKKIKIKICR